MTVMNSPPHFLVRQWFLISLTAILVMGLAWPAYFKPLREMRRLPDVLVAAVLFLTSLPHRLTAWNVMMGKVRPALLAVVISAIVLPCCAWPISQLLAPELGTGLLVVAAAPSTLASAAVWTRRAGGDDVISVFVTLITNLFCFVVAPFWIWLSLGRKMEVNFSQTSGKLLVLVVVPMLAAQLARGWGRLASWADRHRGVLALLSQVGILTMIALGIAECGERLATDSANTVSLVSLARVLLICLVLHLGALLLGQRLGHWMGFPREAWIAVGFSGSQKTLMVGLHLALLLGGGPAMMPVIGYHVLQLLVDTPIADRLRRA